MNEEFLQRNALGRMRAHLLSRSRFLCHLESPTACVSCDACWSLLFVFLWRLCSAHGTLGDMTTVESDTHLFVVPLFWDVYPLVAQMDFAHTRERALSDNSEETCRGQSFASIAASLFELFVPPDHYFGEISGCCKHVGSRKHAQNWANSWEAYCGPLSLLTTLGIPWQENTAWRAAITANEVVEVSFITSGYLEK